MSDSSRIKRGVLGRKLNAQFERYKADRVNTDNRWIKSFNQYKGIYDRNIEIEEGCSKSYPRVTRVKVESFVSRVMNMLFPRTERNWTLKASKVVDFTVTAVEAALQEYLLTTGGQFDQAQFDEFMETRNQEATAELERLIINQMADMGSRVAATYEQLVRKVVRSAVIFALGVLRGPMTETYTVGVVRVGPDGAPFVEAQTQYRPYFEFVPNKNYYPDLTAPSFEEMEGAFVYEPLSKQGLQELKDNEAYDKDSVEYILRAMPEGDYKAPQIEGDFEGTRGDNNRTKPTKRYGLLSFWGWVKGADIKGLLVEDADKDGEPIDPERRYRVFAEVVGSLCIKVAVDPFDKETQAFHHFVFEEDDAGLIGEGLPEIMRESQMVISNASRMLVDNAGTASGPMAEVDVGLIDVQRMGGNLEMKPRKSFLKDTQYAGPNAGRAIQPVSFDSHITELLNVIQAFKQLSDEETFVGPATGGDFANMPSEALRTTSNASMILGNSALPFKEVVSNFDRFTVSVLTALVNWNRLFNADLVGAADARPEARGATSLMAKELRAFAIDNIGQTLTEEERDYINPQKLLEERLKVRDLELDGLLEDRERAEAKREAREQQAAAMAQIQQRLMEAEIGKIESGRLKDISQAQKNLDNAEATVIKTLVEAMEKGANLDELFQILLRGRQQAESVARAAGPDTANAAGAEGPVAGVSGSGTDTVG